MVLGWWNGQLSQGPYDELLIGQSILHNQAADLTSTYSQPLIVALEAIGQQASIDVVNSRHDVRCTTTGSRRGSSAAAERARLRHRVSRTRKACRGDRVVWGKACHDPDTEAS